MDMVQFVILYNHWILYKYWMLYNYWILAGHEALVTNLPRTFRQTFWQPQTNFPTTLSTTFLYTYTLPPIPSLTQFAHIHIPGFSSYMVWRPSACIWFVCGLYVIMILQSPKPIKERWRCRFEWAVQLRKQHKQ